MFMEQKEEIIYLVLGTITLTIGLVLSFRFSLWYLFLSGLGLLYLTYPIWSEPEVKDEVIKEVEQICANHKKKYGLRKQSIKKLRKEIETEPDLLCERYNKKHYNNPKGDK